MKCISDQDLHNQPDKLQELLKDGDVLLTSRGKPYALVVAVDPERVEDALLLTSRVRAQAAVAGIRRRVLETELPCPGETEIEAEIQAARRERKASR